MYIQSDLDMIHSYLVHSDWKDRVNRYIQTKEQKEGKEDDSDYELEYVEEISNIAPENKAKYVTTSYGFGVDHRFVEIPTTKQKNNNILNA